jgi:hypothetical protein
LWGGVELVSLGTVIFSITIDGVLKITDILVIFIIRDVPVDRVFKFTNSSFGV